MERNIILTMSSYLLMTLSENRADGHIIIFHFSILRPMGGELPLLF